MSTIDGKIKSFEPIKKLKGDHGEYSMLVFAIEKQQNHKKRLIAFKVFGKKADEIAKLGHGVRVHLTYVIESRKRGEYWSTDLIITNWELYEDYKQKKKEYIDSYMEASIAKDNEKESEETPKSLFSDQNDIY